MASDNESGAVVGIDLGTTYSSIAMTDPSGKVEVIPNSEGYTSTPSVVYMSGDTVLVGREAARIAVLEPENVAQCFKRDMGRPAYCRKVDGKDVRPEMLSALVLKKLAEDAKNTIGKIQGAVVTVPAFFDETRRKATSDACKIAGINLLGILNEPSAAALGYGYGIHGYDNTKTTFLVYDLGGGTFDVTLMRITGEHQFETIGTDGDVECGGEDWNKRLFDFTADEFQRETGMDLREDTNSAQELRSKVEECKRSLSKLPSVTIPVSYQGKIAKVPVSQNKFAEITVDLLTHTRTTTEILLDEKKVSWEDIDEILLVGGSTHMPQVRAMLEKISGKKIPAKVDADLAVVRGAAIYAASLHVKTKPSVKLFDDNTAGRLAKLSHTNVNAHSLGIEVEDVNTGKLKNHIIIPKNTPIPCKATETFGIASSVSEDVCTIKVMVLEGEASNPKACINIGICTIDKLPSGLPEGSPVDVTFSYSQDGRIVVSAIATEPNIKAETHIESKNGLSQDLVDTHSMNLLKLKIV
ncbi:MAG: Hsp70 family protein [Victivallales bacterium]|nr:Hsp70 family protein [Victivallales bacterium]